MAPFFKYQCLQTKYRKCDRRNTDNVVTSLFWLSLESYDLVQSYSMTLSQVESIHKSFQVTTNGDSKSLQPCVVLLLKWLDTTWVNLCIDSSCAGVVAQDSTKSYDPRLSVWLDLSLVYLERYLKIVPETLSSVRINMSRVRKMSLLWIWGLQYRPKV